MSLLNTIMSKKIIYYIENNKDFDYKELAQIKPNYNNGVLIKTICCYGNLDMLKIFFDYKKFSPQVIQEIVTITAIYKKYDMFKYLLANITDLYNYRFNDAVIFCLVEGNERALKILIPLSNINHIENHIYELIKKNNNTKYLELF